jgi:hypothetical protein
MGILVDFQKVREDKQEVEYIFGFPGEMDRHLVIQKEALKGHPLDGKKDGTYEAAAMGVFKRHHRDGTWPAGGTWAS